jgi:Zn-finger nucleic acid-binding protein
MQCPKDKIEMNQQDLGGVLIDECPACGGIWFDQGELDAAKDALEPDLNWIELELWRDEERFNLSLSDRECPRDNKQLVCFKYGDAAIEIEYCLQCRGIWLDHGEFKKIVSIVSSLESELDQMSASDYLVESLNEAKGIVTGEESPASQWKDLKTVLRLFQYRALVEKPGLAKALYAIQRTGLGLAGYNPPG